MQFIALAGGSAAERESIAARLIEAGRGNFLLLANEGPDARYPGRRTKHLMAALTAQEEQRASALGAALKQNARGWRRALVIVHCLTEGEAAIVRERGGVLWHLHSRPSVTVVIRNGDTIITDSEQGFGHVRSPLEALSELIVDVRSHGQS